jgi:hypothetical protein
MTSQIAIIPSISERQHRNCNDCYWYNEDTYHGCTLHPIDYMSERNCVMYKIDWDDLQKLPCRFHLTEDELKQILDPYFME